MVLLERAEQQVINPILERLADPGVPTVSKLINYLHDWSQVAIDMRNTMFLPILMSFEFLNTNEPIEAKISSIYERSYRALGKAIKEGQEAGLIEKGRDERENHAEIGREACRERVGK